MSTLDWVNLFKFISSGVLPLIQYGVPVILFIICVIRFIRKNKKTTVKYYIKKFVIALLVFLLAAIARYTINTLTDNYIDNHPEVWADQWDKPIIYIYPQEDIDLEIKLVNKDKLLHTYPKYVNKWDIKVYKDGTIYDKTSKRNYYALYWEGINDTDASFDEGFVVEGKDTISFLEEKLSILGLNEREINEFIIYWLPQMENNKYNLISFSTIEEINKLMPLEFSINPDTLIRVFMRFKPLNKKINIKEQKLETVQRKGFTIVEWGGSKVN